MKNNCSIEPSIAPRRRLNRRRVLQWAALGTAMTIGGGTVIGRRLYAREQLKRELIQDATTVYTLKHQAELNELPALAREQIREYFHGVCLNVHGFVTEVCSAGFGTRIRGCRSEQEKINLCHVTFSQSVVTSVEVINRINVIATEIGQELDLRWQKACRELQAQWATKSLPGSQKQGLEVARRVEPLILKQLAEARLSAPSTLLNHTDLGDVGAHIGLSALRLMPIIRIQPAVGLPLFLVMAFVPLWTYLVDCWNSKASLAQFEISEKLSLLGNRVGAEFETEIRQRIAQLQQWQQESFERFADRHASEVIPLWY